MRGVNKAILVGNLGADPETRYMQSGDPVTNFRIATSEQWKDKATGEKKERTEWHSVTCFGRLAEIAGEYLRKGSKVYVEGQLRTSSWEQDGVTRYKTEVNARELQMLDSKGERPAEREKVATPEQVGGDDFDDSIPFAQFERGTVV